MNAPDKVFEYYRGMQEAYGKEAHETVVAWSLKHAGDVQVKDMVALAEVMQTKIKFAMSEAYRAGCEAVSARAAMKTNT